MRQESLVGKEGVAPEISENSQWVKIPPNQGLGHLDESESCVVVEKKRATVTAKRRQRAREPREGASKYLILWG